MAVQEEIGKASQIIFNSHSPHFNWFYCLKNLKIFFRKVALTTILFFHVVVVLSLISIFKNDCYTEYEYFPHLLNVYKVYFI